MLTVLTFILALQEHIGNGAKVTLSEFCGSLEIRVDWINNDFHARRLISEIELARLAHDSNNFMKIPDTLVLWFKEAYRRR